MRKYFLLSAVAMLMTTTANATTDYAEVTAKATIEVANTMSCDNIDWGTIVVKQNNGEINIDDSCEADSDDLISISASDCRSQCRANSSFETTGFDDVTLKNENGNTITLTNIDLADDGTLYSYLNIPANVKAGTYTGSFTVTVTY